MVRTAIYSKKIIRFIEEIQCIVHHVLSHEIRLKVRANHFYDRSLRRLYSIKIVIYNNKRMLGYFDPHFHELGFHESLMRSTKAQLHNVIRHELAHYITFTEYGETVEPHGIEFRNFCKQQGWDEEVYRASTCLEELNNSSYEEESPVLRKIEKLMALTQSSNVSEAELAMLKAQQLLVKYSIDSSYIDSEEDEKVFLKRIMKQKREDAKMRSIGKILETFFVSVVYHRAGPFTYIEILGTRVNIDIAEYVAAFLQRELDTLWIEVRGRNFLQGIKAKNSFFLGLAKGYCTKVEALNRDLGSEAAHALTRVEKKLSEAQAIAYGRLYSRRQRVAICSKSSTIGEQMGKKLSIHPAINKRASRVQLQIGYDR